VLYSTSDPPDGGGRQFRWEGPLAGELQIVSGVDHFRRPIKWNEDQVIDNTHWQVSNRQRWENEEQVHVEPDADSEPGSSTVGNYAGEPNGSE
jgi:hypothetical protein